MNLEKQFGRWHAWAFACLASLLPFAFQVSINVFDKCADFSPYNPVHAAAPLPFICHSPRCSSSAMKAPLALLSPCCSFPVCLSHYLVMLAISAAQPLPRPLPTLCLCHPSSCCLCRKYVASHPPPRRPRPARCQVVAPLP